MKFFQNPVSFSMVIVFLLAAFVVNAQPSSAPREYPAREQMVWSPDGRYIASAGVDGLITIWDAATKKIISQVNEELSERYRDSEVTHIVDSMSWSTNNELAVAGINDTVQVWNVSKGVRIASLHHPGDPPERGLTGADVSDVVWTPDGKEIIVASVMTNFTLWDSSTYQFIKAQESPSSFDLAMRGDGRLAAGMSFGVANFPSYSEIQYNLFLTINNEALWGDEVVVVKWSFDGSYLLGITFDGRTYIWDDITNVMQPISLIDLVYGIDYLNLTSEIVYLDDNDWTMIGSNRQVVRYNFDRGEILQTYNLEHVPIAASWSPYGARVAYLREEDRTTLLIETPFASLDELTRVMVRCQLDDDIKQLLLDQIDSYESTGFAKRLVVMTDSQVSSICKQEMLAIVEELTPSQ